MLSFIENHPSNEQIKKLADQMRISGKNIHIGVVPEMDLAAILYYIREEEKTVKAKANGTADKLKAVENILRAGQADDSRKALHYASTQNGVQYVCDGYRLVALNSPLDLPELPNTITPLSYERFFLDTGKAKKYTEQLDLSELKSTIRTKKAEIKGWRFGNGKPAYPIYRLSSADLDVYVNAEWLADMVTIFPDAKIYLTSAVSGIIIESEDGRGLLLPMKLRNGEHKIVINQKAGEENG